MNFFVPSFFVKLSYKKPNLSKLIGFSLHTWMFLYTYECFFASQNQWMNYYLHKKEKGMRRKDGDDERPVIHIYIGGSKTCHDATHCVIWPIKIQTIHQPFLVFCYSVHGCKAHSNRKVRWDGVIGVVFQSWSPEKSDFTMTHLKYYFYKERKNQSLWVTFYFVLHLKGII